MKKGNFKEKSDADALELWQGIIRNDIESLGKLFDLFSSDLLTYGYQLSRNGPLTKDAIQDVFVSLWTYRHRLSADVQIKYYLFRCVRRELVKHLNSEGGTSYDSLDFESMAGDDANPETEIIHFESENQKGVRLQKSLSILSLREREIISLKYYSDLKIREIAGLLELKEQTIANTLQNALTKLRRSLIFLAFGLSWCQAIA